MVRDERGEAAPEELASGPADDVADEEQARHARSTGIDEHAPAAVVEPRQDDAQLAARGDGAARGWRRTRRRAGPPARSGRSCARRHESARSDRRGRRSLAPTTSSVLRRIATRRTRPARQGGRRRLRRPSRVSSTSSGGRHSARERGRAGHVAIELEQQPSRVFGEVGRVLVKEIGHGFTIIQALTGCASARQNGALGTARNQRTSNECNTLI